MLGIAYPDIAIFPMLFMLLAAWIVLLVASALADLATHSWALLRDHGPILGSGHRHHPRAS